MSKKPRIKSKTTRKDLPKNFFSVFVKDVLILANKTNRKASKDILEEFRKVVEEQRYKWKPLNTDYVNAKIKAGLDPRVYLATKDYVYKGVKRWEKDGFIFVGPTNGIHKPSGLTYRYLARILEFGTLDGHIPARPIWRPLLSVAIRRSKMFAKEYREGAKKAHKRRARASKAKKKKSR